VTGHLATGPVGLVKTVSEVLEKRLTVVRKSDWSLPLSLQEWERRGFARATDAMDVGGWPGALIHKDTKLRFVQTDRGIYLPLGYNPSQEPATDDWPRHLTREDGVIFVRVPGGEFEMGGDRSAAEPRHRVQLSGFYLQRTEVSNDEITKLYDQVSEENKARLEDWKKQVETLRSLYLVDAPNDNATIPPWLQHPAVNIDCLMADEYARISHGQLPTEAQWEFAARSRRNAVHYPWEWRKAWQANEKLNGVNLKGSEPTTDTQPVGHSEQGDDATEQGILDLAGNVQEWCRDVWGPYPRAGNTSPVRDPFNTVAFPRGTDECSTPQEDPPHRAIRGGSFVYKPEEVDVRRRWHRQPLAKTQGLGFRLVIECPSAPINKASGRVDEP
jgi:serine/threonine-protein kinase